MQNSPIRFGGNWNQKFEHHWLRKAFIRHWWPRLSADAKLNVLSKHGTRWLS